MGKKRNVNNKDLDEIQSHSVINSIIIYWEKLCVFVCLSLSHTTIPELIE